MTDEAANTSESRKSESLSLARKFWDYHEKHGTWKSILFLHKETDGELLVARMHLPYIVEEGNKRGVDMIKFLQEFDNALGTDNGSGELPIDSSDEDHQPQDEDESTPSRDADGEGGAGTEETEGSEGV